MNEPIQTIITDECAELTENIINKPKVTQIIMKNGQMTVTRHHAVGEHDEMQNGDKCSDELGPT